MVKMEDKKLLLAPHELELLAGVHEMELIPNSKGVFLLIDKGVFDKNNKDSPYAKEIRETTSHPSDTHYNTTSPPYQSGTIPTKIQSDLEEEKQQVIGLIRKSHLGDLVEGKFESTLDEKQQKALLALVATHKVFVFKLNDTYKKGVYRVKEDEEAKSGRTKKESEQYISTDKPLEEYSLERDGFMVIRGHDKAREISFAKEGQIKDGLLKGIKSFDGNYYLIETALLEDFMIKAVEVLNKKSPLNIDELAQALSASRMLTRIVCEFLKDEGEIVERRKEQYGYVK